MTQDKKVAPYTLVFAEDEAPAREKLAHQLSLMDDIDVIGYATTGKEAVQLINSEEPDIVLLDIQMPEIDGLDVVDLLDYQPIIIFTTAYDQYAINAFEKSSTDYLLKPFPLGRLKAALDKAKRLLDNQRQAATLDQTQPAFGHDAFAMNKLVSKNGDRIFLLSPGDIKYIKSAQGSSLAWNGEKLLPINDKLDQLEQSLANHNFVRIHRGYLVNLDHVKEIQRWFNGKLMIIVNDKNKTELSTSRAGAEKLKTLLNI